MKCYKVITNEDNLLIVLNILSTLGYSSYLYRSEELYIYSNRSKAKIEEDINRTFFHGVKLSPCKNIVPDEVLAWISTQSLSSYVSNTKKKLEKDKKQIEDRLLTAEIIKETLKIIKAGESADEEN